MHVLKKEKHGSFLLARCECQHWQITCVLPLDQFNRDDISLSHRRHALKMAGCYPENRIGSSSMLKYTFKV